MAVPAEPARVQPESPVARPELAAGQARRVALIGVPNCGKSLIFNRLTGRFSTSANYPYTTVEVEEARVSLNGQDIALLDTPGITGLELTSEDEAKTREMLRNTPPDVVVQCIDAGHLVRSLILTAQLSELKIPTVLAVNMVDEALNRGLIIDTQALGEQLGVPVISLCALDGRGIDALTEEFPNARVPVVSRRPVQPTGHGSGTGPMPGCSGNCSVSAVGDSEATLACRAFQQMTLKSHHAWAKKLAELVVERVDYQTRHPVWNALARAVVHPVGAWAFLALTIVTVYFLVVEVGAKFLCGQVDRVVAPIVALVASWTGGGFLGDLLVGPFGLLTLGLFNAVGTALPILATFYLPFSLLEEIGYFPRLSLQFDRLMRFVGLNGKAVLPMTLGFGCSSMACLSIRRLETPRERFIGAFLISLGIPCAAQLGVILAILAILPFTATLGVVGVVLVVQLAVGAALRRLIPEKGRSEFLVELPPMRAPNWTNVLIRTYRRIREFVIEAVPLFLASAGILFVMHAVGFLDRLRNVLAPVVVTALGLPRDYADIMLVTLARREMGAVMLKNMATSHRLSVEQLFIALLVIVLFVPCMTTGMVLARVLGWRRAVLIFTAVTAIAIAAGSVAHILWR